MSVNKSHNWKSSYHSIFDQKLQDIKNEGHYRYFNEIERKAGQYPKALHHKDGKTKEIDVWCSNDYLSMSQNTEVMSAMKNAVDQLGAGSGGTRNISGTTHYHVILEQELAELHNKESALLFTSGYISNEASLSTLASTLKGCVVFSDELNHSSMIQGIRSSGATKIIFKHNDVYDLIEKISKFDKDTPKIIAFESIYSMDGDIAPVEAICNIAKEYNALTYLDEVHAVGMYGNKGGGISEELGISNEIDIIEGTLAKAYGVMGGYITGNKYLVDTIRSFASGFIFTTSIPPAVAAGASVAVNHLKHSERERIRQKQAVSYLKQRLRKAKISFIENKSHIVPIKIGNPDLCKRASDLLLKEYKIYVQPINYPTVPRGTERLRVTPSPMHTNEMINHLVDSIETVWKVLKISRMAA